MIALSDEFYREICSHPMPTDLEAAKALSSSPVALDLFTWRKHMTWHLPSDVSVRQAAGFCTRAGNTVCSAPTVRRLSGERFRNSPAR